MGATSLLKVGAGCAAADAAASVITAVRIDRIIYFAPPGAVFFGAGGVRLKVKAVNCISSHVWSPQKTSLVGSGFALLPVELSYQADVRSFVPFGSASGSL